MRPTRVRGRSNLSGEFPPSLFDMAPELIHCIDRPVMRISHARSRYIYDLYYKRELITKELYDWLIKQGYADAKWVVSVPIRSSPPRKARLDKG